MNSSGVSTEQKDSNSDDREKVLKDLGIFNPQTLASSIIKDAKKPFLVDGLLRSHSVNVLVGDSCLGKTPLAIQLGVAIAAGLPVFGKQTQKGAVLYCDGETGKPEFSSTLGTVSRFMGMAEPPADFHMWSPVWEQPASDEDPFNRMANFIRHRVDAVKPAFVVIDALRTFFPEVETKNQHAAEALASLKKAKGVTWLLVHHRRKVNHERGVPDLLSNPHGWFQESAGAFAIINQSDTRIGVEEHPSKQADLLVAGLLRGTGPFVPLDLARVFDNHGEPVGYQLVTGITLLNNDDRGLYERLPESSRFKDVQTLMGGTSASNVSRFLKKCLSLQIVKKEGIEYVKASRVECVERVEQQPLTTNAPPTPSTPQNQTTRVH